MIGIYQSCRVSLGCVCVILNFNFRKISVWTRPYKFEFATTKQDIHPVTTSDNSKQIEDSSIVHHRYATT